MMDEMKIKLTTKFMRNVASKLIAKAIRKKLGYKVDIQLNDLDFWVIDGDTTIALNVEAKLKSNDFMNLMKDISNMD